MSTLEFAAASPKPKSGQAFIERGIVVVTLLVGAVVVWSVLAPIQSGVIAVGQLTVDSSRKVIQHLEGGMVSDILVREGEQVQQGQLLVRLDATAAKANLSVIENRLAELYARRARLQSERDTLGEIAAVEGAENAESLPDFDKKLSGQKEFLAARTNTQSTEIALLFQRIEQQEERIKGLGAQRRSMSAQQALVNEQLNGVRRLYAEGYATKTRVQELEREATRLEGELGAIGASIAESTSVITALQLEINRVKEARKEQAIEELRDVEASIAELEEKRVAATDARRRTEIRAPQSGRILGLAAHTIGGVVSPGAPLMEIVPDGDRLVISVRISPKDVDKVRIGQESVLRFTSIGARRTPESTGVVRQVSADVMADRETGAYFYSAIIDARGFDGPALRSVSLMPGMPVEALIKTESRPALSYFVKPLSDSIARAMREE